MSNTRDAIANPPRQARPATLAGGLAVHVRDLTFAEIRRIEKLADQVGEGERRGERYTLLAGVFALAEPDGRPAFPDAVTRDAGAAAIAVALEAVAGLTVAQLKDLAREAFPDPEAEKKE